jgi:ubiquinone/menaquinone biosynthesis C-methylase UbiE
MGVYARHLAPRIIDVYPPGVRRVLAVDPQPTARKLAEPRVRAARVPIAWVGHDGEDLDVEDASVDHALTTFTLCSIGDVHRALAEMHRVLRPGGALHFLEHGRSPEPRVARWQDRLTPVQRRIFSGCHLNRPIDRLIADAGFAVGALRHYYLPGPRPYTYMFEGVATRG